MPSADKRQSLNVRKELARLREDPLDKLVRYVTRGRKPSFLVDEIVRYIDAYDHHYLSIARFYREMSVAYRWRHSAYYTWKYRGRYSEYERHLTAKYRGTAPYLELDMLNCFIHARILLDRSVALARHFLPRRAESPSFNSFAEHKRFFIRKIGEDYGVFQDYADHFRRNTGWFEQLKDMRDKFIVHQGPKHTRSSGYPFERVDMHLVIGLPTDMDRPLGGGDWLVFSVRDMTNNIDDFLRWFCRRGLQALRD